MHEQTIASTRVRQSVSLVLSEHCATRLFEALCWAHSKGRRTTCAVHSLCSFPSGAPRLASAACTQHYTRRGSTNAVRTITVHRGFLLLLRCPLEIFSCAPQTGPAHRDELIIKQYKYRLPHTRPHHSPSPDPNPTPHPSQSLLTVRNPCYSRIGELRG